MSFRSFEEIVSDSLHLINRPNGDFWAHIDGHEKDIETLYEHLELVGQYFLKLVEANGIEPLVEQHIVTLINETSIQEKIKTSILLKEIFTDTIIYHDLGKVNPNFQVKLKNPAFQTQNLSFTSQHSALGAFLFCSLYIDKLLKLKLNESDTNTILLLVLILGNPINRHHSSYIDIKNDLESFPIDEFINFLSQYQVDIDSKVLKMVFRNQSFIQLSNQFTQKVNSKAFFLIFSFVKLNFSLLTASDYYATGDYMSGMAVSQFGIINQDLRNKINHNFKTLKSYNNELIKNLDKYLHLTFDKLQERCGENLNKLRQKLNADVISELRKNKNSNWYYIEAPTGAGKTNLSLACINELISFDKSLKKAIYVFPFTTLITQTFIGIKETIGLSNDELIQLHSKAGLHEKESKEDGIYGNDKYNYIDYLFSNYPFMITTHVKFFDILKGNSKDSNYLFHRLSNSIIILDEIQSYNPKHWDKMIYFLENIAPLLNIRFIIMSATLPKIDALSETLKGKIISLTPNRDKYFKNPNFAQRIKFDFSMFDEKIPLKEEKQSYLNELAKKVFNYSEKYAKNNNGAVRVLIEFITKNSASLFFLNNIDTFKEYQVYLLSGDILEPRRKEIIQNLKSDIHQKVLLISTQVVEAGVDIDMDLGFKNHALIDSDEQLAGRINRNANKENCVVYLFKCDSAKTIYGQDLRYKQQQTNEDIHSNIQDILINKTFHQLYEKVFDERKIKDPYDQDRFDNYHQFFENFDLINIDRKFRLIDENDAQQLFIPLKIHISNFEKETQPFLYDIQVVQDCKVNGELVFELYKSILKREDKDFLTQKIDLRKIGGILSQFTINIYPTILTIISDKLDRGENGQYGFEYMLHHDECYSYENGFDFSKSAEAVII